MTDHSQKREAEEYGFGPNKAPRTQEEIHKARYGEAVPYVNTVFSHALLDWVFDD